MSSKQRKKASLAALKSARSGRRSTSALDDVPEDDTANADVYEVMDETEYREYVERKREREDFVVDDGKVLFVTNISKRSGVRQSRHIKNMISFDFIFILL
jgi:hypothetical protein